MILKIYSLFFLLQLFGDVCFHCNRVIEGDGKHFSVSLMFFFDGSSL